MNEELKKLIKGEILRVTTSQLEEKEEPKKKEEEDLEEELNDKEKEIYNKAIEQALKRIDNTKGGGCFCTMREPCDGSCKPTKENFYKNVLKLKK